MVERESAMDWTGSLVRLLIVFRTLVLFITILVIPQRERTVAVVAAILIALAVSYIALRHWDRIAPTVSEHPAYLAVEVVVGTFVLAAAGAKSPFFFFTLGTAAIAGVIYGRRGAIPFTALLICAYEVVALEGLPRLHPVHGVESIVLAPLLYPLAIGCGIVTGEMVVRGAEAELELRSQGQALSAERERLRVARELHDSLAKTVEGLAMTASVLPSRCESNPEVAARIARNLAEDARQAALEARMLMADLRPQTAADQTLQAALEVRAAAFAERSGVDVAVVGRGRHGSEEIGSGEVHELLRIVSEALTNAAAHGGARHIRLLIEDDGDGMAVTVSDDGEGLAGPVDLEGLKAAGHFGLAGMDERARSIGGRLSVRPSAEGGTAVTVTLPGAANVDVEEPLALQARRRWWPRRHDEAAVVASTAVRERA